MSATLRLPGLDPPQQIRPRSDRREPVVWVRRLRLLHKLAVGNEHLIREDIVLRRGMNIVWAPPHEQTAENALFQDGIAGHTAGKTTLCRLIRYVLGERTFAPKAMRQRIREEFSSGWVLAEVLVAGCCWAVARPLGGSVHPFCVCDAPIDTLFSDVDRLDFTTYLEAIEEATSSALPAKQFPTSDKPVRWEHVLPWLSRDQECRFSDFMEWRHESSDSQSPSLNADEHQFVVRSVLGLISDQERVEQQNNARLLAQKKEAFESSPLLKHQASVDHLRVQKMLDSPVPPPSHDLFGARARSELEERRARFTERQRVHLASDRREELREALERAVAAETAAAHEMKDAENQRDVGVAVLGELGAKQQGDNLNALFARLPPARGHCDVPLIVAQENGCPLARSRPVELDEHRARKSAAEEAESQRRIVETLEAEVSRRKQALAEAGERTKVTRRDYLAHSTAYEEEKTALLWVESGLDELERLIGHAEEAEREAKLRADQVAEFEEEIKRSYEQQEELRKATQSALDRLTSTFDYVIRALAGEQVSGRVEKKGRSLRLVLEEHGERESSALGSLKLLAFDLAALTESIEGRGFHPRFLIHDGPREADMAPELYERLFLYVRKLEACFEGEASFQYIVTTTTPPPQELCAEPWLCVQLRGAPAEERLLKMNL